MTTSILLAFTAAPTVLALCLFLRNRLGAAARRLAPFAALPVVLLAIAPLEYPLLDLDWLLLGARFELDAVGWVFLIVAAIIWTAAGVFSASYLDEEGREGYFFFFLVTMTGNLALPLAADAVSFYTAFSVMTFAGYGLILHIADRQALRAGAVYISLAVVGELFIVVGLMVAVRAAGVLDLHVLPSAIAGTPQVGTITALLLIGFGIKAGAVPLHVWLPLAHPVAPTPASAALSGAMIKAGVLGWLRFLPIGDVALADLGLVVLTLGLTGVFFAAAVGFLQDNPKTVLAYSSVSQIGLMSLPVGVALGFPEAAPPAIAAVTFFAAHHGLAKAALFLGVGVSSVGFRSRLARTAFTAGLVFTALTLAGIPFTSGKLAKSGLQTVAHLNSGTGSAIVYPLITLSGAATALLMTRFLILVIGRSREPERARPEVGIWLPWAVLVSCTVLLPIAATEPLQRQLGVASSIAPLSIAEVLSIATELWPIVIGIAIFAAFGWRRPEWVRGSVPPDVPPGDILYPFELATRRLARFMRHSQKAVRAGRVDRLGAALYELYADTERGMLLGRLEAGLTRWAMAVVLVLLLGATVFLVLSL